MLTCSLANDVHSAPVKLHCNLSYKNIKNTKTGYLKSKPELILQAYVTSITYRDIYDYKGLISLKNYNLGNGPSQTKISIFGDS
jgi:hypothetical protein